jgi:isoleucyl-tRNA synthetase
MINTQNSQSSVHLQNFPDVSFIENEQQLASDMDLVRLICSAALFIRDQKNLRVRLPLAKLIIIGKKARQIENFKDIICEEINVKTIEIKEEIAEIAELKLQINFKKIGVKYGSKVKEITEALKNNRWQRISDNEVVINILESSIHLFDDEFEIKLNIKNSDDKKYAFATLPTNDCLIQLDIEVTSDLQKEGIARDIVRIIQQNRKDANLNVSDRINLKIFSSNHLINKVIESFESYIKEQTLCLKITKMDNNLKAEKKIDSSPRRFFENEIEDGKLDMEIATIL